MFKHILVPTDGSDITAKAISTALSLAKSVGAQLHTISAKEPFPYSAISEMQPTPPQEFFDAQERIASQRVQAVVRQCEAAGVPCQAHTGVTACHNLLAMEHAGLPGSVLYPGSWSEWSADPSRPVALGA